MAGLTPLASPSDLCTRLGTEVPTPGTPEYKQIESLLSDASGEIRASIGQQLSRATSTIWLYPDGYEERRRNGRKLTMSYVDIPATPVVSIEEVAVDGETLYEGDYFIRHHTMFLPQVYDDSDIKLTYTHGFDPLPDELVKWTCILAAGALNAVESTGALGVTAGISQHTVSIDDYTEGWANYTGNKAPGMSLPPDVVIRLRASYGAGGISTVSFR